MYDLVLIHAPSIHDFRTVDDVMFGYLSNSATVHVSPIYEMPPVGILALEQHLRRQGLKVEFFNVASRMLKDPDFDVTEFFRRIPARMIGLDLHWLVHSHGSLELAALYKSLHPEAKSVFGGISSTYYHQELLGYPQVDYVVRGYDTLMPLERLVLAGDLPENLAAVPNLSWKHAGEAHHNEMTHAPAVYSAAVDWKQVIHGDRRRMTPYNLVIPQAGCEYNCTWCGGSRYFFERHMGIKKRVQKPPQMLREELQSLAGNAQSQTVTMIDFWHETPELFEVAEDIFLDDKIDAVHYSLHRLPALEKAARMGANVKAVVELSPDSHEFEVSKLSGRGKYTMDQMEAFIDALLEKIHSFEVYFMIGLPRQTERSVWETVDYCHHLLRKYQGKRVVPFVAPMLPFLDPGSQIFDDPAKFGYRIRYRTLEDHRRALLTMNWKHRLNYETEWLSHDQLVELSYKAVAELTRLKHRYGGMPASICNSVVGLLERTHAMMGEIDAFLARPEGPEKLLQEAALKKRIYAYNQEQLKTVRSQQRPVDFGFAATQQWFDTDEAIERVMSAADGEQQIA